jgi:hypothetical protein
MELTKMPATITVLTYTEIGIVVAEVSFHEFVGSVLEFLVVLLPVVALVEAL